MEPAVILAIAFFVIGLVLLLMNVIQIKKAKAAEAWPTISGLILSSELHENRRYNTKSHVTNTSYEPRIQYQYSILGQNYLGTSLYIGKSSYSYGAASKKIETYPQGAPVVVHYNPADPSKAVLEPKAASGILNLVIGIILMVFGPAIALYTLLAH
ncbi:MAG: DUF3592 domain-containing protein [Leptolinea sp.]